MPVHDWTMAEYLAFDALSSSGVHCLAKKSPKHFREAAFRQSKAMAFGSLQHMALLQPGLVDASYAQWSTTYERDELVGARPSKRDVNKLVGGVQKRAGDRRPKSGKIYDAFEAEALLAGLEVCTDVDMAAARATADRVRNHADLPAFGDRSARRGAGPIVTHPELRVEVSRTFVHPGSGLLCKMRPDGETPELTFDIKCWTRELMTPHKVWSQAYSLGYETKAAWYQDGRRLSGGGDVPFVLIFVQVVPPYEVAVLDCLEAGYLDLGRQTCEAGIARFVECSASGYWPGCMDGITHMQLPPYADFDNEEVEFDIEGA